MKLPTPETIEIENPDRSLDEILTNPPSKSKYETGKCVLANHEIRFWELCFVAFINRGFSILSASESADKAIEQFRERYNPNTNIGPYR